MNRIRILQKKLRTRITFMRHGESELNLLFRAGKMKRDSLDFQDSPLTSQGIIQIENLASSKTLIYTNKYKYVFVSPLRRTLQTSFHLFKNSSFLDKMTFLVHPMIREKLDGAGDIPLYKYPELSQIIPLTGNYRYNFHFMKTNNIEQSDLYYIESLQKPMREKLLRNIYINKQKQDPIFYVLDEIRNLYPDKLETGMNVKARGEKFIEDLREFIINEKGNKEIELDDILVITHRDFIENLTAKSFNQNGAPVNGLILENLETTTMYI